MTRPRWISRSALVGIVSLMLVGSACGMSKNSARGTSSASPIEASMTAPHIKRFEVHPKRIEIKAGTTITWTNEDQILHTVTSGTPDRPLKEFDGSMPDAGTTFAFTFRTVGTYPYFCERHPAVEALKGVVVVT